MAQVYFAPNSAIRYVGDEPKEFSTSLARPKPFLKHGDIIIVDRRTAFNLVHKGFGEFEDVEIIELLKAIAPASTVSADTANSKKGIIDTIADKLSGK